MNVLYITDLYGCTPSESGEVEQVPKQFQLPTELPHVNQVKTWKYFNYVIQNILLVYYKCRNLQYFKNTKYVMSKTLTCWNTVSCLIHVLHTPFQIRRMFEVLYKYLSGYKIINMSTLIYQTTNQLYFLTQKEQQ